MTSDFFAKIQKHLKYELYNVISGKSQVRFGATIQTVASYLNDGSEAGSKTESAKQIRKQEQTRLGGKIWGAAETMI